MQKRRTASIVLLMVFLGVGCVLTILGHDRAAGLHVVEDVQTEQLWAERQQTLWQEIGAEMEAQAAAQQRLAHRATEQEVADIAEIAKGDQAAMLRQSAREDAFIRSVIRRCDTALVRQLPAVAELAWPLRGGP